MKYLTNDSNLVRDAALAASNVIASHAIYRTDTAPKVGGGYVALTGPYTGGADAAIDVEIVDVTGGTSRVSQPVFSGVGNGLLSGVSASGVPVQEFVVSLEDLGTETRRAYAPFQGVTLRARSAGDAGNAITIDVDHSALTAVDTNYALQADLRAGVNEYLGDEWNFGAATIEATGTVPVSAPRLQFGGDPQVYRAFRRYRDGRYVYSFSPAPVRDVARGARVRAVSGSRTLTIRGGSTETLPGITTLFDALSAIRDHSTQIEVDGPIVNDRLPGGQGTVELSVWTRSYIAGIQRTGGDAIRRADLVVSAAATAPTETLSIKCVDATAAGAEAWEVRGDVSGRLPNATTGQPYSAGVYTLFIPASAIDPSASTGVIVVEYLPEGDHGVNLPIPSLCVISPRLGSAAQNGTWEFMYTPRPPEDCDCTIGQLIGGPNNECLGTTPEGGDMSDTSMILRAQRLTAAVRELMKSNTLPPGTVAARDVNWINTSAAILSECLTSIPAGTLRLAAWEPEHTYLQDDMREPAARNGYRYVVTVEGTSGVTTPSWPTSKGASVTDGTVTWECLGRTPWHEWDAMFTEWHTDALLLLGYQGAGVAVYPAWSAGVAASPAIGTGSLVQVLPTARNGCVYTTSAQLAYTSDGEPAWSVGVGTVSIEMIDNGSSILGPMEWRCTEQYWVSNTLYAEGALLNPHNGSLYRCTTSGTSGATVPNWAPGTTSDGSAVWTRLGTGLDIDTNVDDSFFARYRSMAADVLASAGISPNFDGASANGDGCWRDHADSDHWWVFTGREPYLPMQTGHYYHSVKMGQDARGRPFSYSTREFGFGAKFGCPEHLAVGDKLRVTISGVTGAGRGYQGGDEFAVGVTAAYPVPFGGGQTGDDTLTWSIVGSEAGRLADYALITTAPLPYADGGVALSIAPGGIPFALGDQWRFWIEGGRCRWRRDGGAWSAPLDIEDVPLTDGLVAQFAGGVAPSWAVGDRWSFLAEATNGVDQIRRPVPGSLAWTGSTAITIVPAAATAVTGLLIAGHTIPADADIRLQGSDDGFVTVALDVAVSWHREHIWLPLDAMHAEYRLLISAGGSIRWLHLGDPLEATWDTDAREVGQLVKRVRLPGLTSRRALGVRIEHQHLPQTSVDALLDALSYACEIDARTFAVVPNDQEREVALVRYVEDSIELTDARAFQPRDVRFRRQAVTLELEPVP